MTLLAATGLTPTRMMGKGLYYFWKKSRSTVFTAVCIVGAIKAAVYIRAQLRRKKWNSAGKDVVVLHMFPRGHFTPSLSPFVLKLETYLRMAEIPYEVDFEEPLGPKGKCPWITFNGEEIGDSQLIIETLGKKFEKNFSQNLTEEQRAITTCARIMVDEHFIWCLADWRFVVDDCRAFKACMALPKIFALFLPFFKRKRISVAKVQGIGVHSPEAIQEMGMKDLRALSTLLGDKPYFTGDEPTEVDCTLFGMLAQIQWNSDGSPYLKAFENELTNLSAYCFRVKDKLWPDWDNCIDAIQE